MTIPLTGTGGLFTRVGKVGRLVYEANRHQAGLPGHLDALFDQFDGDDRLVTPAAIAEAANMPRYPAAGLPSYADLALRVLFRMVALDNPAAAGSAFDAVSEVVRQMKASGGTVKRCQTAAAATPIAGTAGTGSIVLTTVRGDGTPLENCVPETARVVCVADSYTETATAGAEGFRYYGAVGNPDDAFAHDWPQGSNAQFDFAAIDPASGPDAAANVVTNGGFETWTVANTPDSWTIEVGSAGGTVFRDAAVKYAGSAALRIAGGATLTALSQAFSEVIPLPLSAYAVSLWVRVSAAPAAGVLTVELVDGTGAVVADAAGTANSFAVALTGLAAATWTNATGTFRLPKAAPPGLKLRLRLSTALTAGVSLYVDHLGMGLVSVPYPGGPGLAVFAGSTPFALADGWAVRVTNDRGGQAFAATNQALWDRLFGMRAMGLQLPSSLAPTVTDAAISGDPAAVWSMDFSQALQSMYLPLV